MKSFLKTIIVRWEGPHTLEIASESNFGKGLYFFTGRKPYERTDQIQYFGITEGLYRRRFKNHSAIPQVTKNLRIWFGQVEYPKRFNRTHLELAEGCMVYFWGGDRIINRRKLIYPPEPVCLISKWTKTNGDTRLNRLAIYRDLPDVLWWDGEYWRTGNLKAPFSDYE